MVEFECNVSGPIMVKGSKLWAVVEWNVTNTICYQVCMVGSNASTSLKWDFMELTSNLMKFQYNPCESRKTNIHVQNSWVSKYKNSTKIK